MLDTEGAGADGQDDDGQSGSGAPEGGSSKDGSDNDDKPITAKQLKAALESQKRHYESKLHGQRAEFEAFKEGVGKKQEPAGETVKTYTRADLRAAVDAKQITQEQADDLWDRQRETQITENAKTVALDAVSGKQAKERIDADLASYKRLAPEIMDAGSTVRTDIQARYQRMVRNGLPGNLATELAAIEAVLGPLEKLERARSATRKQDHDQQSGGGGEERPKTGNKLVDGLDARTKAHYQKGIDAGRYKDWKEVEAELKFSKPTRKAA